MLKKLGEAFFEYKSLWKQAGVVLILAAILLILPVGSKTYSGVEAIIRPFILAAVSIVFALVTTLTLINALQKAKEEQ
ncbi:hypothetical protein [Lactobacillus johnsonii]|uniref:Uncharacterized protein n=1 Tax=Lactobacillus johnsonii TaxID=33959 RepID=A0A9X0LY39_LACJH|nr:hypothetical protein [Lactobacillus johnsonii]KXN76504.1 hypothetical protein AYJ53_03050 [Lactobacillus johnsonii]